MKKLVYLHELDSVRTSELGISHGLNCLFEEVVKNGNYVALTMNQLADSRILFSAIQKEEDFNYILSLFEKGIIRISRYIVNGVEIRTLAQYMLQSLNKNISLIKNQTTQMEEIADSFITSALPIKHSDIELLTILRDAIMYSDPDLIRAKCTNISFGNNAEEKNKIVEYLCTYVSFILSVSKLKLSGNPPKAQKAFLFEDFMKELEGFDVDKWFARNNSNEIETEIHHIYKRILTVTDAVKKQTILTLACEYASRTNRNNRSNWHNYFSTQDDEYNNAINDFQNILTYDELLFAEMLVDLCYNYTVEESIENISLHYTSFEDKEDLHADIKERIIQYWKEIKNGLYSPRTEEFTDYIPFLPEKKKSFWDTASRIITKEAVEVNAEIYETNYHKEQKEWLRKIRFTILKNIGIAFFYIVIFCVSNLLTGHVQEFISTLLSDEISNNFWFAIGINVGLFTIIFAIINSILSKLIKLPDILESMNAIYLSFKDTFVVHRVKKTVYQRMEHR